MRRRKVNEGNYTAHKDWAIDDVKEDLDKLLKLHESLKSYQFNEQLIRDSISTIKTVLVHLHSAYRIESMVGTGVSDDKNLYGEAEDEMLRAKLEAEKLVRILDGFNHKFYLNP
jgi:hypothetical protein